VTAYVYRVDGVVRVVDGPEWSRGIEYVEGTDGVRRVERVTLTGDGVVVELSDAERRCPWCLSSEHLPGCRRSA
jgi:hypothetical protein